MFDATGIDYNLSPDGLTIGRLDTNQLDALPIPDDEDADLEIDPMDHCDNSLPASLVNPFGCLEADADKHREYHSHLIIPAHWPLMTSSKCTPTEYW